MVRRPFGLIGRPLEALLPETVQLPAFVLQMHGGLQRDRQGGWFEGLEDPLTQEGVYGPAGEVLAIGASIGGRPTVAGIAMQRPRAPLAPQHPAPELATQQEPGQEGGPMAHGANRIRTSAVGR